MTEEQWAKLPPEERAVELMTSAKRLPGGRADAKHLLGELRAQWASEVANIQRTAHDQMRPHYHWGGEPCQPEWNCHVSRIIDLAETARSEKGRLLGQVLHLPGDGEGVKV